MEVKAGRHGEIIPLDKRCGKNKKIGTGAGADKEQTQANVRTACRLKYASDETKSKPRLPSCTLNILRKQKIILFQQNDRLLK